MDKLGIQSLQFHSQRYTREQNRHQGLLHVYSDYLLSLQGLQIPRHYKFHHCHYLLQFHSQLFWHHLLQYLHFESGRAEVGGNDAIITLASYAGGIGTTDQQAGTLMHELGHNLGLLHGGPDTTDNTELPFRVENCKPNYLSVMNYARQFEETTPGRDLDYSQLALLPLDENNLDEGAGVQLYTPSDTELISYGDPKLTSLTGVPIDWNRNSVPLETGVSADINNLGIAGCNVSSLDELRSYEDWSNIPHYNFRGDTGQFADGIHTSGGSLQEIVFDALVDLRSAQIPIIVEAINALDDSVFAGDTPAKKQKNRQSLINDLIQVESLINQDLLEEALQALNAVRQQMDGSEVGADPGDDLIIAEPPDAQEEILPLVDTLRTSLIIATTPPNKPPIANNDTATTSQAISIAIPVLENDADPEGDSLILLSATTPSDGTTVINPDNTITYTPASIFVGVDTFAYVITDDASEGSDIATGFVEVTVEDITPPTITVPADVIAEATGLQTSVDIGITTAIDSVDPSPVISNDAPAGFPLGDTTVTWTATDSSGNIATATQLVTILDTTPPSITPPADQSFEATAVLTPLTEADYGTATASDIFTPVTITSDAPATFPLGATTVTYTALDANGNSASDTQIVTVVDTTPPSITPPADQSFEATAVLTPLTEADYGTATASDIFTPVTITSDAPDSFLLGQTIITWTATDSSGNTDTTTQSVIILDTTSPTVTVPADIEAHATGIDGAQVFYSVELASDLVDGDIVPTCNPQSGAVFPIGSTVVTCSARDSSGNLGTASFNVIISNNTPVANDDGITALKDGSITAGVLANDSDADDDVLSIISVTQPANGQITFNSQSVTYTPNSEFVGNDLFTYTISDPAGGTDTGEVTVTVLDQVPENNPPIADANGPYLTEVNTPVNLDASFSSDPDDNIATYQWDLDYDGISFDVDLSDTNSITSATFSQTGIFTIAVKVTDAAGEFDIAESFVTVYDPSGGFVTGGGWIDSPAGAYTADPDLTGKANFGFVSKYKKGAAIPTGVTQFQFKTGNLNFHSDSYEFLVIAGAKAIYKGVGTINGEGNFGFMLSVIDADVNDNDSHEVDKFRIKIFDNNGKVYDNQVGEADDNADPTTEISGGSIKIHKSK